MTNWDEAKKLLEDADAIIITAGNGMAQKEGLDILNEQTFSAHFSEIAKKYNVHTIGDALYKKFDSWLEKWNFWSQLINNYSLEYKPSSSMLTLKKLLKNKKYFVVTSTFAHFFETAGFAKNRIFNIFGDWTKMQCSSGINHHLKDSRKLVKQFIKAGQNKQLTVDLIPRCEVCQAEMELHIPLNGNFYPDDQANSRLRWFLTANEEQKVVILELGVDQTSPQLLEPMVKLVQQFPSWNYIATDLEKNVFPVELEDRVLTLNSNIDEAMINLTK